MGLRWHFRGFGRRIGCLGGFFGCGGFRLASNFGSSFSLADHFGFIDRLGFLDRLGLLGDKGIGRQRLDRLRLGRRSLFERPFLLRSSLRFGLGHRLGLRFDRFGRSFDRLGGGLRRHRRRFSGRIRQQGIDRPDRESFQIDRLAVAHVRGLGLLLPNGLRGGRQVDRRIVKRHDDPLFAAMAHQLGLAEERRRGHRLLRRGGSGLGLRRRNRLRFGHRRRDGSRFGNRRCGFGSGLLRQLRHRGVGRRRHLQRYRRRYRRILRDLLRRDVGREAESDSFVEIPKPREHQVAFDRSDILRLTPPLGQRGQAAQLGLNGFQIHKR